eukprot:Skav225527  [mRNA]  locus=scaffold144:129435:145059:- [translate_table: standard]
MFMLRFGLALILQVLLRPVDGYAWMAKIKAPSLKNLRNMRKGSKFGDKKLVVITGTSSGLGKMATKALLRAGDYHVVGAVRDLEKMKIVAEIEGFDTERFTAMSRGRTPGPQEHLDLASFDSWPVAGGREESVESEVGEEEEGPFLDPYLRARWAQLVADPARYAAVRAEVDQELGRVPKAAPELPDWLRRGPRVHQSAAASSSSPAPKARPSSRPVPKAKPSASPSVPVSPSARNIVISKANPLLRANRETPRPVEDSSSEAEVTSVVPGSSQPSSTFRPIAIKTISANRERELEYTHHQGQGGVIGEACISWDFHQVLDVCRHSKSRVSRCERNQRVFLLPSENREVISDIRQTGKFTQCVLSYCHHPSTVQNVLDHCLHQEEFNFIGISRHPTGRKGKLEVLRALFDIERFVIHIDDSPEVVREIASFIRANQPRCQWKVIQVRAPRKESVEGVKQVRNPREAAEFILWRTGLSRSGA